MRFVLIPIALFTPLLAFAAGFANQAIFVSKSPVTDGDHVRIYAVVTNPATASFKGTVVISDNGSTIGTIPLTLAAGGAQTVSTPWQATAGSHTFKAAIMDGTTEAADIQQTITVAPKPQPVMPTIDTGTQSATAVDSSANIQQSIGNVSPQVESAVKPVFTTLDGVRQSIANVADQQLANIKPKVTPLPGADASGNTPSTQAWYFTILYTIYFYILTLVRFFVGSAGVFYPVLALAFLYFIWRMFRRYRRG